MRDWGVDFESYLTQSEWNRWFAHHFRCSSGRGD